MPVTAVSRLFFIDDGHALLENQALRGVMFHILGQPAPEWSVRPFDRFHAQGVGSRPRPLGAQDLTLSANGSTAAVFYHPDRVKVWFPATVVPPETDTMQVSLPAGSSPSLALNPRGDVLALAYGNLLDGGASLGHSGLVFYKVQTATPWRPPISLPAAQIYTLRWSPDGKLLGMIADGRQIWLCASDEDRLLVPPIEASSQVEDFCFNTSADRLATVARDGTAALWDAADHHLLFTRQAHRGAATAVAFSPNMGTLITAGEDGQVCLWTLPAGTCRTVLPDARESITSLDISDRGDTLAAASKSHVTVWHFRHPLP